MAPLFLNLGIRWKSAIGRKLLPLFLRGKNACTHLIGGLVGPRAVRVVLQSRYIYIYIYIYHLKLPGLFSYCADYGTPAAGDKRVVIGKLKRTASNSSSLFSLDPGTRAVQYMFHHRPSKVRSQTMCNCVSNTVQ